MDIKEKLIQEKLIDTSIASLAGMKSRQSGTTLIKCILDVARDKQKGQFQEDKIIQSYCDFYGVNFVPPELDNIEFDKDKVPDNKYLAFYENQSLPIKYKGEEYILFACGEADISVFKTAARLLMGKTYKIGLTTSAFSKVMVNRYIRPIAMRDMSDTVISTQQTGGRTLVDLDSSKSSIQENFHRIIKTAYEDGASDIHLLPQGNQTIVSFRVDGIKMPATVWNFTTETVLPLIKHEANMGETGTLKASVGKIKSKINDKIIELRVNVLPAREGPDINMRILAESATTMDKLGMSGETLAMYQRALTLTKGLVLVVGPMGSGKTTTLYAGLTALKERGMDICTIEDPVEITLPGITQIDVTSEFKMSDGQEAFLRHNCNVQVYGELRDEKTAAAATRAALTGVATMSTLHTNSAGSTVARLRDLHISDVVLSECLAAVISQRLVRKVCPECGYTYKMTEDDPWRKMLGLKGEITLRKGSGCPYCKNTGYKGRTLVQEGIFFYKDIREAIAEGQSVSKMMEIVKKHGFKSIAQDAIDKALQGITTFDEISPIVNDILEGGEYVEELGTR